MKAIERLQDRLDRDLSWRKKELSSLRVAVKREEQRESAVSRASWVIACGHWEGFLKCSLQLYIEFVFAQEKKLKELSSEFIAIALFRDVMKAAEANFPGSKLHHVALAERISLGVDVVAKIPGWFVQTESNPTSSVTQKLLLSVGLDEKIGMDEAGWSTAKAFLDEQLLAVRNAIAHGEGRPVKAEDCLGAIDRVEGLCESLIKLITGAAVSKSYLSRS